MENIFIILACFVVIGVKAYLSATPKEAENKKPITPQPLDLEEATDGAEQHPAVTLPEEGVRTTFSPSPPQRKRKGPKSHSPIPTTETPLVTEQPEEEPEWSLHSAEKARRAIVWSEILKPKF